MRFFPLRNVCFRSFRRSTSSEKSKESIKLNVPAQFYLVLNATATKQFILITFEMTSIKHSNGKMAIKHLLANVIGVVRGHVLHWRIVWTCARVSAREIRSNFSFCDKWPQQTSSMPFLRQCHLVAHSERSPQCYILIKGFRNNNGDDKDGPPSLSSAFGRQTALGGMWEEPGKEEGREKRSSFSLECNLPDVTWCSLNW